MAQGLDGIQMRGINDLALNYSKQQLAHLVQIGQLDPAKAMLAGMAIDRVQTNAQKPPTATVFDDVLGQQAQQPQDMSGIAGMAPQQGQQPQQMPQEGAGVSALPSGIEGMADGGIVGYDDGGVVRYDGGGITGQGFRKDQMLPPPKRSYGQNIAQQMEEEANAGTAENIAKIEKMLAVESDPKKRAYLSSRRKALLAEQGTAKTKLPPVAASVAGVSTGLGMATIPASTNFDPAGGGDANYRISMLNSERAELIAAIAAEKNPANKAELQKILDGREKEIARLSSEKQFPTQPYSDLTAKPGTSTPAAKKDSILNPFADPQATTVSTTGGFSLPALSDPRYKVDVPVAPMEKPKVRSVADITAEKTAEEQKAGVEDVYSKMIKGISEKREDLAGRKGEAIGEAIMMAGLKLMGARKGQEFKALSEGAQEGLKQFAANMKEVKALQDKYDERMDAYRLAENEAKRTGVASALATVEKEKDRLQLFETKIFEAKNDAAKAGQELAVRMRNTDMNVLFGARANAGITEEEITNAALKNLSERGKNKPTDEEIAEAKERIRRAHGMTGNYVAPAPSGERIVQKYGNVPKPAGSQ